MQIRFIRGVANTPAGAVRDVSAGAASRLVRQGAAVRVEDAPVEPAHESAQAPFAPAPSDHKAVWVDYAAASGYTADAAKAMTKRELIAALS